MFHRNNNKYTVHSYVRNQFKLFRNLFIQPLTKPKEIRSIVLKKYKHNDNYKKIHCLLPTGSSLKSYVYSDKQITYCCCVEVNENFVFIRTTENGTTINRDRCAIYRAGNTCQVEICKLSLIRTLTRLFWI